MRLNLSYALVSVVLSCLLAAAGDVSLATAGGFGCGSAVKDCYEKVSLPDTYASVAREVVVQSARTEVVREPVVVMTRVERLEIVPGRWQRDVFPAQYGSVERSVLLRPASVSYSVAPAQYRAVHETVVVRPGSWRWERQIDRHGRETMCRVSIPAETRVVRRQVMVAAEKRIAHTTPAVYQTVRQEVELAPQRVKHTYIPGSFAYAERRVVVRAAQDRLVSHPAVTSVVHQKVLVQKGGTSWRRTSGF
ncbi:MAG: hypothetical protein HOO99_03320 [Hyphomicrobiaceae bacterium]|nr:hypothetical protein [Hyphomicrobiaceae bacterium]